MLSFFSGRRASLPTMNNSDKLPLRRKVRIVVDPKDPRLATVMHDDQAIFTIKTDVSGMHPSVVVVARRTYLKSMTKGKTGIILWNGTEKVNREL